MMAKRWASSSVATDLLPPGQSVLELCDLRLQLRHPGAGLSLSKTKPLLAGLRDHASPR